VFHSRCIIDQRVLVLQLPAVMVDIMIDLIQPYNEEETAFQNALDQAVLLTPAQQTGLRNDNVISATDLGPFDDATILDCFTNATRLTASQRTKLYAFCHWIREQQVIVGYGNVQSSNFNVEQLSHTEGCRLNQAC